MTFAIKGGRGESCLAQTKKGVSFMDGPLVIWKCYVISFISKKIFFLLFQFQIFLVLRASGGDESGGAEVAAPKRLIPSLIGRLIRLFLAVVWKTFTLKHRLYNHQKSERVSIFLFHLYPPVTRKRQWRYILDESSLA